jgi:DNA-binding NarL/FixJ family response regulator
MIRIFLVDDQNLMRQGLKLLLDPEPELEVVGTAENGETALQQVEILQPDLVLLDIEMPLMNGIAVTHQICQHFPRTKVLVLSSHENTEYVVKALQAGAKGYLLKHTLAEDLVQAIRSVHRGYSQLESKLLEKFVSDTVGLVAKSVPQNGKSSTQQILPSIEAEIDDPCLQPDSFAELEQILGVSKASLDPIFVSSYVIETVPSIEENRTHNLKNKSSQDSNKKFLLDRAVSYLKNSASKLTQKCLISVNISKLWQSEFSITLILLAGTIAISVFFHNRNPQYNPNHPKVTSPQSLEF